ncbi:glycosyltransferase [Mucilaginibacter mali]|uniref:Glycosyltransferase n=1 Tax=Mucilaginibacter mali TaxID=2740462 RepID=A0A7D4QV65_9SPHI|nr:glycosyltransferase family 4 protein [Mucilaginibacter mali]QKJ31549.1 glycosyltransferase [Mucilaginibacter mali]
MKVTLINTSDAGGGAPAACMRLLKALRQNKVDANLLVQDKKTGDERVTSTIRGLWSKLQAKYNFYAERVPFIIFNADSKAVRFAFSTANTGTDISDHQLVTAADLLHLHWTSQGFQSINNLIALSRMGKPVVWTLHDMWTFTGGCHYAGDCDHYLHQCGHCWMLRDPEAKDISNKGWQRKMHLFSDPDSVVFVTCSHWLADVARTSSLLQGYRIETIPNPIDTEMFLPMDNDALRVKWNVGTDKKIILFGAANILDRRKGMAYLVEALNDLRKTHSDEVDIVVFGKNKSFDLAMLPFKVHDIGILTSQQDIAELYSLADVFVTPAIEDNLPNTVMEALSCGTPVVAFNTGGIPDMVDHMQNGYLAEYKSGADFAAGIRFVLDNPLASVLATNARNKVLVNFSNEIVAEKYTELYRSLLEY